jgi:adenylosuccinate lyase
MAAGARVKQEGAANDLLERIAADPAFGLDKNELDVLLDANLYIGRSPDQVTEFIRDVIQPILDARPAGSMPVTAELKV